VVWRQQDLLLALQILCIQDALSRSILVASGEIDCDRLRTKDRRFLTCVNKDPGLEILEQRTGIKEGKGISTIQIATAAALSGYQTNFLSKNVYFNEENLKIEFCQEPTTKVVGVAWLVLEHNKNLYFCAIKMRGILRCSRFIFAYLTTKVTSLCKK
jgi:hypothetical protein